jgi:hypothetical protein
MSNKRQTFRQKKQRHSDNSINQHDLGLYHIPIKAIARAMGYRPMEFVNAYNENIGKQNIEVLFVKFVESWYDEGKKVFWEGSTKEALEQLNKIAQLNKIDTSAKVWPKASNYLTRPILSNLIEGLGINIVIGRQTTSSKCENCSDNNNTRKKNIALAVCFLFSSAFS